MQQRIKIFMVFVALAVVATVTLSLSRQQARAQTPDLSVNGAIYGGTNPPVSTKGPVLPCYTSTGLACAGSEHVVIDTTTVSLFENCNPNSTCQLKSATAYDVVSLPSAPQFTNVQYACSATIWTLSSPPMSSAAAYVGFCQPATKTAANIYMFNPPGNPAVSASATVYITYSASGF